MTKQWLPSMIMACACIGGASAASPDVARTATLQWRMSLDAEGRVTALVAKGDAIEALRTRLEQVIPSWEFEAGTVEGKRSATETLLSVRVVMNPSADGRAYSVTLGDVRTGGSVGDTNKSYPRIPGRELRKMIGRGDGFAQVAVEVEFDAGGKATGLSIADGTPTPPEALAKAVMKALREWTYEPERVAGVGVPGSLVVPVCFTVAQSVAESRRLSKGCRWTLPGSDAYVEEGQSLALDSQVRLKTDVSGSVL